MNYTTIQINDKEYGLRFGMNAVLDMDGVDLTNNIKASAKLIVASHRNYCEVKDVKPEIEFSEVYDWIEDSYFKGNQEVINTLTGIWESFNNLLAPMVEAANDKKKQPVKRSKK